MIKADIVKEIASSLDLKDKEALVVVDGVLESMKEVICEHRRLEIRDFGVFQVKTRKERVGRNPRDKVEYPIPARQVVTFRIGKELKEQIEANTEKLSAVIAGQSAPTDEEEERLNAPGTQAAGSPPPAAPEK